MISDTLSIHISRHRCGSKGLERKPISVFVSQCHLTVDTRRMPVDQWSCVRIPEHELLNTELCIYCREKQAQFIPSGALGPCCGNLFLPRIHGRPSSCWEQAKKEGWPKFNQRYFENNWEAKMAPLRKSSENHTLRALDTITDIKIASYIFGWQCNASTRSDVCEEND